jgi:hypothetical protein
MQIPDYHDYSPTLRSFLVSFCNTSRGQRLDTSYDDAFKPNQRATERGVLLSFHIDKLVHCCVKQVELIYFLTATSNAGNIL